MSGGGSFLHHKYLLRVGGIAGKAERVEVMVAGIPPCGVEFLAYGFEFAVMANGDAASRAESAIEELKHCGSFFVLERAQHRKGLATGVPEGQLYPRT